jgi:hypothetical protein
MAVRGILYIHKLYYPLHWWHKDKQGWVPLQEKRPIRFLPWLHPEGTWVPLSINGEVSLVTLDQVSPMLP